MTSKLSLCSKIYLKNKMRGFLKIADLGVKYQYSEDS
jgi:hypothetical protein